MTVEEAIRELSKLLSPYRDTVMDKALSIAISALEKEKEPALQEAKTSSNKNVSIKNDNTKLKICQDIIDKQIKEILDYYDGQLSDDEQKIFDEGQRYSELTFVQMSLKEENK